MQPIINQILAMTPSSKIYDFMDLFLYRNKILRAYHDSRKLYAVTREEYEQIEQDIDKTFKYLQRD